MDKKKYIIKVKEYKVNNNLILSKNIRFTNSKILDEMYDLLFELDKLFTDNQITYFISSGTLLGYKRHNGFIPWDNDVDVCIFDKDISKIEKVSKQISLNKKYPFNIKKVDPGYVFIKKKMIKKSFVDISVLSLCDENIYKYGYPYIDNKPTYISSKVWLKDIFEKKYIFPIQRSSFLDFKVNVPFDAENILFQLYDKKCLQECKYSLSKNLGHQLFASTREKLIIFEKILTKKMYVKLAKYYASK